MNKNTMFVVSVMVLLGAFLLLSGPVSTTGGAAVRPQLCTEAVSGMPPNTLLPDFPAKYLCSDTDGGIDFFVKGTMSGSCRNMRYSHTDYCLDSKKLREYYCNSDTCRNGTNSSYIDWTCTCAYYTTGPLCIDGACIRHQCSDSDGKNYYLKGTVSGWDHGVPYKYTDECASNTTVKEYYCNGSYCGTPTYELYNCAAKGDICVDGACV